MPTLEVTEEVEKRKKAKYAHFEGSHCFISVAIETLGVFNPEAHCLIRNLVRRIANITLNPHSAHYFRYRTAVAEML